MAKTNLKEMPVEVRSSGKEPQNDFFAAFLEYVKQHADEAIAAVEAQKNAASTIADATNEDEQKVLRDIAGMVSAMADEPLEKEED